VTSATSTDADRPERLSEQQNNTRLSHFRLLSARSSMRSLEENSALANKLIHEEQEVIQRLRAESSQSAAESARAAAQATARFNKSQLEATLQAAAEARKAEQDTPVGTWLKGLGGFKQADPHAAEPAAARTPLSAAHKRGSQLTRLNEISSAQAALREEQRAQDTNGLGKALSNTGDFFTGGVSSLADSYTYFSGQFASFLSGDEDAKEEASKTAQRIDDGRKLQASLLALVSICAGYDEAAHQRKALAIDLHALESLLRTTRLVTASAIPSNVLDNLLHCLLLFWSDMRLHQRSWDHVAGGTGHEAIVPESGREQRAIDRLNLGAAQFDAVTHLLEHFTGKHTHSVQSEKTAADILTLLGVLMPTVLYSSSSRVACVVRAIMMKKVKDECLAEHALSQTVLEAADLVNAGVLALQVKAALKEKMKVMRGRSWRKSSAGALDFDV